MTNYYYNAVSNDSTVDISPRLQDYVQLTKSILWRDSPFPYLICFLWHEGFLGTWCSSCGLPSEVGSFVFLDVGPFILFLVFSLFSVLWFIYDWQGFIIFFFFWYVSCEEQRVWELDVALVVCPLRRFICLLGCGSFHFVLCFLLFWVLLLIYGWQGFIKRNDKLPTLFPYLCGKRNTNLIFITKSTCKTFLGVFGLEGTLHWWISFFKNWRYFTPT
jgi:hypothetical protein